MDSLSELEGVWHTLGDSRLVTLNSFFIMNNNIYIYIYIYIYVVVFVFPVVRFHGLNN